MAVFGLELRRWLSWPCGLLAHPVDFGLTSLHNCETIPIINQSILLILFL